MTVGQIVRLEQVLACCCVPADGGRHWWSRCTRQSRCSSCCNSARTVAISSLSSSDSRLASSLTGRLQPKAVGHFTRVPLTGTSPRQLEQMLAIPFADSPQLARVWLLHCGSSCAMSGPLAQARDFTRCSPSLPTGEAESTEKRVKSPAGHTAATGGFPHAPGGPQHECQPRTNPQSDQIRCRRDQQRRGEGLQDEK